jgi:5'-phosphate synthase pdxT subunit
VKIGVLALQGAVAEHIEMLSALNTEAIPVRLPSELDGLDALIIPGGESTTISKLLSDYGLTEPIRDLANQGFPMFGTCAGLILLAKKVPDLEMETIGVMDIEVKRNAFGRQVDSFEADLQIPALGNGNFHGIFIRAPIIEKTKRSVEILCQLNDRPVAARQGKLLACAFHPELTGDLRFHRYFLNLVKGGKPTTNPTCHSEGAKRPKNLTQGKLPEETKDPSLSLRMTRKSHPGETVCKR